MIYGNVHNEFFNEQAAILPKPLCAALHYLKDNDLTVHEPGKFDVTIAGVPMILQVIDQKTAPRELLRPEIHRRNIDVQFLASGGPEEAGFYSDDGSNVTDEDLLATPRDILFYRNNPEQTRICLPPPATFCFTGIIPKLPKAEYGCVPARSLSTSPGTCISRRSAKERSRQISAKLYSRFR